MFRQVQVPGRLGLSDFTDMGHAGVSIADAPLDHRLYTSGSPIAQFGALGLDRLCMTGVLAADDLVDEAAIGGQLVEIGRAAQQQGIGDGALEMTVRALDGAVLMGDAGVVAGRGHAVVTAQFLIAVGHVGAGILVEIAEGGR